MNFRSIAVICGAGKLKYGLTPNGDLLIWVHDFCEGAPDGAMETEIAEPYNSWTMTDEAPPNDVDEVEASNWAVSE